MRHHPTLAIAATILAATLLGACGTKGPLTQLPPRTTPKAPPAQTAPASNPDDLNTAPQAPR